MFCNPASDALVEIPYQLMLVILSQLMVTSEDSIEMSVPSASLAFRVTSPLPMMVSDCSITHSASDPSRSSTTITVPPLPAAVIPACREV